MRTKCFNKVFAIGLNKTGSTSLHAAFEILGLKSVHFQCSQGRLSDLIRNNFECGQKLLNGIDNYECYSDWFDRICINLYPELDKQYPNSLFICTTRDLDSWIESRMNHLKRRKPNLKELQRKHPDDPWLNCDTEFWKKQYIDHYQSVANYFKGKEDRLLMLNIIEKPDWTDICSFLKLPVPNVPFPHENKAPSVFRQIKRKVKDFL